MTTGRIYVDVSSLARWKGPPVGMVRVEQELALHALAQPDRFALCFFDPAAHTFRLVAPEWAGRLIGWDAVVAPAVSAGERPKRWQRIVPGRLGLLMALERRRLTARRPAIARRLDALQRLLLGLRHHTFPLDDEEGNRVSFIDTRIALGPAIPARPGDLILTASSDWWHKDLEAIAALKARTGAALACVCYDIIPLLFPHYFPAVDAERFRTHWEKMFATADLTIVNAGQTAHDVQTYCRKHAIALRGVAVVALGQQPPSAWLADGEPKVTGRFALYVSTIEPRKNHALLLRVWRRLVDEGVPQRHGFRLVFVGRRGWMVEHVLDELRDPGAFDGTLLHLSGLTDAELAGLYEGASFGLYPSMYEGFGLPVIECFARGKPVIASNGGALAEVAGALSPVLDPRDDDAWYRQLRIWIEDDAARDEAAARVRQHFVLRTWRDVAEDIVAAAAHGRPPGAAAQLTSDGQTAARA